MGGRFADDCASEAVGNGKPDVVSGCDAGF